MRCSNSAPPVHRASLQCKRPVPSSDTYDNTAILRTDGGFPPKVIGDSSLHYDATVVHSPFSLVGGAQHSTAQHSPTVVVFDSALPLDLQERLKDCFRPPWSPYWIDHRYFDQEGTPYFSYLYNLVSYISPHNLTSESSFSLCEPPQYFPAWTYVVFSLVHPP